MKRRSLFLLCAGLVLPSATARLIDVASAAALRHDGEVLASQVPYLPPAGVADGSLIHQPGWVPAQRPVPGEADVISRVFEALQVHSLNPPSALSTHSLAEAAELRQRLVVAVALGVHSGGVQVTSAEQLAGLPLIHTLLYTFLPTAQPWHRYRFYLAFDHGDPVYDEAEYRLAIEVLFARAFERENAKRWHPPGYVAGTVDGSTLVYSVHWVRCEYRGKPSWAHSDAVVAAYTEGADYVYRTNDDSSFPAIYDWVDRFIQQLRQRALTPNVGVVGPTCPNGATWILTHDFTHKTHVVIFGFHYPRSLPDWSSDDWITYTYQAFGLMQQLPEAVVDNRQQLGTRYKPTSRDERLPALNSELQQGAARLAEWLQTNKGVALPYTVKQVECC